MYEPEGKCIVGRTENPSLKAGRAILFMTIDI